jgi:geranylgeranyl reductase family protein
VHPKPVIIGAGPAGATCSLFLAKLGIPHVIIDKAVFPRDKVCGDALSGKVLPVLRKLDPALPGKLAAEPTVLGSHGIVFTAPGGGAIEIPFKSVTSKLETAPGFISRRIDFDQFLVSRLDPQYADFRQGTELTDANPVPGGVELQLRENGKSTSLQSPLVICCDGDRSVIAKKLGGKKVERAHYCGGIRAYYKGVTGLHERNFIELHFLKDLLPGYFWIFPLPGGYANVGAGMLSKYLGKKKENLRDLMHRAIEQTPSLKARFAHAGLQGKIMGWGLPLGSRKRALSGDHFLLCGDAGSLIDPFTGEGISNAMFSGMLAAETVAKSVNEKKYEAAFLSRYDDSVYRRLWSELRLSHTLQKLCRYPWLFDFVINKANRNPTLRNTISSMFDDLDLRQTLRKPSFYMKLLFNSK